MPTKSPLDEGRALWRHRTTHLVLRALRERQHVHSARHDARHDGVALGVAGADGVLRRRVEMGHHRLLATVVGTVSLTRCAWRALNVRNAYPADAALSLRAGRHSHGLAKLAVAEAVHGSFDAAKAAIEARCGPVIGKRQIEQLVVAAARDVEAFYGHKIPAPASAEVLLVLSVDGKGIVMRPEALRPATAKAAARRRSVFRTRTASGEASTCRIIPPTDRVCPRTAERGVEGN
ncbi:hypothetical protein [Nonomuraea basaltis]|uniref:hypothetical protein n=1 Tax=Nonomuraea basaltis TaxID=2495887 RepID=UPI00110C63A7|nr:hypothetical protein [Nonomuraea basaltis]TMR87919.1 hypothetical protein EJK15_69140 [Nonomuraea basaltis]